MGGDIKPDLNLDLTKSAPFKQVGDIWECLDRDKPFWTAKDGTEGCGSYVYQESQEEPTGLEFVCPGCKGIGGVSFKTAKDPHGWTWNGNLEKPTCTPSILHNKSKCGWHGYLTAGEFKPC